MSYHHSLVNLFPRTLKSNVAARLALILAGIFLSIGVAYLIITGKWYLSLLIFLALPVLILLSRYPLLALLFWLLFDPFLMITPSAALRGIYWLVHRGLPPLVLVLMMLNSILQLNRRKFSRLGWPELAIAGYVIASLLSIFLLNKNPLDTFYIYYDRVISPICLYLIIRLWAPNEKEMGILMPVLITIVIFQVIIGLLAWFYPSLLPKDWLEWAGKRTTGSLRSYGSYATAMIFSALPLLTAALSHQRRLMRNIYLISFSLGVFGVFISFSRAAWLAGGLVLIGLFFLYPKFITRLSLITVPILFLLLAGPLASQVNWAKERLYSAESSESALSRLPVYLASSRMIAAKPLFGWGYENFNVYDYQFYGRVGDLVNATKDHSSHNFYLTLLAEQGLTGFFLFLAPVAWWLVFTFRAIPTMSADGYLGKKLLLVFWLFMLAHLVVNLFQSMRVVFSLGLWWVNLALIANIVERHLAGKDFNVSVSSRILNRRREMVSRVGRSLE